MRRKQMTTPLLCSGGKVTALERIPFADSFRDEDWLQGLLFEHPDLVPQEEIDPKFRGSFPIARELRTDAGQIDLLYINSTGYLTIAETKLWRNPEARRAAVVQIIDYAKELSGWSFEELFDAVQGAMSGMTRDQIVATAKQNDPDFDQVAFHDTLTRNLKSGNFLLLLIGDGIQEGIERISEYLNKSPQLHFTIGLVEMGLYRVPNGSTDEFFVQPRILARTHEISRSLVEIRTVGSAEVRVSTPVTPADDSSGSEKLDEKTFIEGMIERAKPETVEAAKWIIEQAKRRGFRLTWGKDCLNFWYDDPNGPSLSVGRVSLEYQDVCFYLIDRCTKYRLPIKIGQDYYDDIVALIPGAKRYEWTKSDGTKCEGLSMSDEESHPPFEQLARSKEKWFEAIDRVVERVRAAAS